MSEARNLAELLAPNFLSYLSRNGSQAQIIDEEIPAEIQLRMVNSGLPVRPSLHLTRGIWHHGTRRAVTLDNKFIGLLEIYDDPGALAYSGRVPGILTDGGAANIRLIYKEPDSRWRESGRTDGWKQIPFP